MRSIIDSSFISMLEGHVLRVKDPMDGLFGGNRLSRKYGSSVDFADYRDYQPGDDLRKIDWNLYARFDRLYLKLFNDERQQHHRIYIDTSASMDWGEPSKGEMALKLAAAFAFLAVSAMDRVSVYLIRGGSVEKLRENVVGREGFYLLAEELNSVEFCGESHIGTAFSYAENPGHNDGVSILISDFLTEEDWMQGVDRLVYEKRRVELVQILSRDEMVPDISGQLYLLDSEGNFETDRRNYKLEVSKKRIEAYYAALRYMTGKIRSYANAREKTGYFLIVSDESIEKMLFESAAEEGLIQ